MCNCFSNIITDVREIYYLMLVTQKKNHYMSNKIEILNILQSNLNVAAAAQLPHQSRHLPPPPQLPTMRITTKMGAR